MSETVARRNGEGDADIAARRREDRRVHADHFAVHVEGRAAGIAAVHRRVDLQEVVVGAGADVAAFRRDDAGGHRAAEAERIADREHPLPDLRGLGGEGHILEAVAFDLQQRDVGALVLADQLGVELAAVIHHDRVARAVCDDMRVGDEIAVIADEEARALAHALARMKRLASAVAVAAVIARPIGHAEAAEEFLQRRGAGCRSPRSRTDGRRRRRSRSSPAR